MNAGRSPLLAALVCGWLTGCSNYDFRSALGADGQLDLARLKEDASRAGPLQQVFWLPFIHRSQTACQWQDDGPLRVASDLESLYPAGLTVTALRGYGPLFAGFHRREARYDAALAPYESIEGTGILWRLWTRSRSRLKVPGGVREEVRTELLFGILKLPAIVRYQPER